MPYTDTALKLDDLPVGESRCVQLGDTQVGLFHEKEGLFAIDNYCPHRSAPMHEGFVKDAVVTCPWHQWQFRLSDGICLNIPGARTAVYPLEIRDGAIWVNLDEKGATKS